MSTGNPLLDAYDKLAAEVAGLSAAIKAADPEAVKRAAEAGAKAGASTTLIDAAADVKTATTAAKEAAQKAADAAQRVGRGIPRPLAFVALLALLASLGGAYVAGWYVGVGNRDRAVADADRTAQATAAAEIAAVRTTMAAEIAEARQLADKAPETAKWANSPAGKLARQLDRAGSLELLARCKGRGWQIETQRDGRKACMPFHTAAGDLIGWYVE